MACNALSSSAIAFVALHQSVCTRNCLLQITHAQCWYTDLFHKSDLMQTSNLELKEFMGVHVHMHNAEHIRPMLKAACMAISSLSVMDSCLSYLSNLPDAEPWPVWKWTKRAAKAVKMAKRQSQQKELKGQTAETAATHQWGAQCRHHRGQQSCGVHRPP